MSHRRAHQSDSAWQKSPATILQVIKRMIRRQLGVCWLWPLFSFSECTPPPPPHNLVIHPQPLSVNKCCRLRLPVWWNAVYSSVKTPRTEEAHRYQFTLSLWADGWHSSRCETSSDAQLGDKEMKCKGNCYCYCKFMRLLYFYSILSTKKKQISSWQHSKGQLVIELSVLKAH